MKQLLESLSLGSGAAVVAICSATLAWFFSHVRSTPVRYAFGVLGPLALSVLLYQLPVWLGADDKAQYSTWLSVVIPVWSLAGIVSSVLVLIALRRRQTGTAMSHRSGEG
jgi:uncharacterized membrane protein YfcA